jgi:hypothetical protein
MSKEALRKFHMNLLNHCDEFLELNVDIRIIDDYALQLANELEQALTTDRTLVNTLHDFRNRWCRVKTSQELNEVCSYFINEVWKDFLKESEATK